MQAVVDEGSTAQPSIDQQSLYDKLGGRPALQAAVNVFYDKMLADPRVSHFFDGLDMRVQRAHQVWSFCISSPCCKRKSYGCVRSQNMLNLR